MSWYVGVDVGGTFTDVVLAGTDGSVRSARCRPRPTTRGVGVIDGVVRSWPRPGSRPATCRGSCTARRWPPTSSSSARWPDRARHHRGVRATCCRLGREARVEDDRYDLFFTPPTPPVDPRLTFEVAERMDVHGDAARRARPTSARRARSWHRVAAAQPTGVAVCFLHSYANPEHERVVGDALRAALPGTFVAASSRSGPRSASTSGP